MDLVETIECSYLRIVRRKDSAMNSRWIAIASLNAMTGFAIAYGLTHDTQQALAVAALQSILLRITVAVSARAPALVGLTLEGRPVRGRTARSPRRRSPPARPSRFAEA
jgi:hypothetical protein